MVAALAKMTTHQCVNFTPGLAALDFPRLGRPFFHGYLFVPERSTQTFMHLYVVGPQLAVLSLASMLQYRAMHVNSSPAFGAQENGRIEHPRRPLNQQRVPFGTGSR